MVANEGGYIFLENFEKTHQVSQFSSVSKFSETTLNFARNKFQVFKTINGLNIKNKRVCMFFKFLL